MLTCDTPSPVCSWQNATFRLDNIKAKRHLTRPPTISHMEIDACELSESKHGSSAPECSASLNNEWKWAAVCHFLRYKKRGHYRAFQNASHRSSIILEYSTVSRYPCLPRSIASTSRSATRDFTHSLQSKYECGKWDAIGRWLTRTWQTINTGMLSCLPICNMRISCKPWSHPCVRYEVTCVDVQQDAFLPSKLDRNEWSASGAGWFILYTNWAGGWVDPTAALDVSDMGETSCLRGIKPLFLGRGSNHYSLVVQPRACL